MNRAERRKAAREALRGKHLKGTQKREAIRQLSAALAQKAEQATKQPEEVIGSTRDEVVSRRKSGLYAVRTRLGL